MMRVSAALAAAATGWRTTVAVIATVGFLVTATVTAKSVVNVPKQLAQHDSTTQTIGAQQTLLLKQLVNVHQKMLCIQIADHRHTDWTECLIPSANNVGDDP